MITTIKYKNCVPTKKSLQALIDEYDTSMWALNFGHSYGQKNGIHVLTWQRQDIQNKIDGFIAFATERGVKFGKFQPYESPRVGHLYVLPNNSQ